MTPNTWDGVAGVWRPFLTSGLNYYFQSDINSSPRKDMHSYWIGKTLYQMPSLRFDEGDALSSSFNDGIDDASSYTIAMVCTLVNGEEASLLRVGTSLSKSTEVFVSDKFRLRSTGGTAEIKGRSPAQMTPCYLVLSVDPTTATLWVGDSYQRVASVSVPSYGSGDNLKVFVGDDLGGEKRLTANLFDMVIYPESIQDPRPILSALSSIYGNAK